MKRLPTAVLLCALLPLAACGTGTTDRTAAAEADVAANGQAPREGVAFNLYAADRDGEGTPLTWEGQTVMLQEPPLLTSADIERVEATLDAQGQPVLQVLVRKASRQRLHDASNAKVGKQMALTLDGQPVVVMHLQGAITESFQVTGIGSLEALKELEKRITGAAR